MLDVTANSETVNDAIQCIHNFNQSLDDLKGFINDLDNSDAGLFETSNGISLLDLKNHLMVQYLIHLCCVFSRKLSGESLSRCNSVYILTEIRTILERIQPLNLKIQYQIDTMMKTLANFEEGNVASSSNPLTFRPKPDNLDLDDNASEVQSSEDEDKSEMKELKYIPPKLTPMHYDEDINASAKQETAAKRMIQRLSQKEIIQDLQSEFLDTPEEVHHSFSGLKFKERESINRKIKYEEETFSRLPSTKHKHSHFRSLMKQNSSLADITDFSGASLLYENSTRTPRPNKNKKSQKRRRTK